METENEIIISRSNLKTISFGISLPVGSASEPKPGLTDIMITHMYRNTGKYGEREFADLIDNYGIKTFNDIDRTRTIAGMLVPPKHLKKAIEIFVEIWNNSHFDEQTIQKIVQQQIGGLQQIRSTPEDVVTNYTKWQVAFAEDPITRHPYGTIDGVQNLKVEDFESWIQKIKEFSPYFVSVGLDVSLAKYKQNDLDSLLSSFGNKSNDSVPTSSPKSELKVQIDTPEVPSSNSYIGVNMRGSDPSENNYSEDLFRSIISGGMSARMFTEIREKRNLSYAPRLSGERFNGGSLFTALMDVRPDRAVEALDTTVKLLHEALIHPIPADELNRALKVAQRIAVFVSDSSSTYTNFILGRLSIKRDYRLEKIKENLINASLEDWQNQVMKQWTKKNMSLAVSGETGELPNKWEEIINEVF